MVFKFLGLGGKKKEFFLEADPQAADAKPESKGVGQPEVAKAKAEAKPAAKLEAKAKPEAKAAPVEAKSAAPAAPATPVAAVGQPEAAASKKGKTSIKSRKKGKDAAPAAANVDPTPKVDPTPVAKAPAAPATFAASNLLINSTSRRRPGPSLDKFKTMARDMRRR
jgi:hypothetical protein